MDLFELTTLMLYCVVIGLAAVGGWAAARALIAWRDGRRQ